MKDNGKWKACQHECTPSANVCRHNALRMLAGAHASTWRAPDIIMLQEADRGFVDELMCMLPGTYDMYGTTNTLANLYTLVKRRVLGTSGKVLGSGVIQSHAGRPYMLVAGDRAGSNGGQVMYLLNVHGPHTSSSWIRDLLDKLGIRPSDTLVLAGDFNKELRHDFSTYVVANKGQYATCCTSRHAQWDPTQHKLAFDNIVASKASLALKVVETVPGREFLPGNHQAADFLIRSSDHKPLYARFEWR